MSEFARGVAEEDQRWLATEGGRPDWELLLDTIARERAAMERLRPRPGVLQRRKGFLQRIADRLKVRGRNSIQSAAPKVVDQPQSIRITVRHGLKGGVQKKLRRKEGATEVQLILGQPTHPGVLTIKVALQLGDDLVLAIDRPFSRVDEARQGRVLGFVHRLFSRVRGEADAESGRGETRGGVRGQPLGGAA